MKVAVIEGHDETARNLLTTISKLNGAVERVETYPNFQQFVRFLPRRGQPDLLFVDMGDLDAKARRFLKSGKLTSLLILTNPLKLNGYQLEANKEQIGILQHLSQPEETIADETQFVRQPAAEAVRGTVNALSFGTAWQERFLVKGNQKMIVVQSENISHFFSEGRLVFLRTKDGKKYVVQYTLEELSQRLLNPRLYFRVNRSFIVSFSNIKELKVHHGGRLKVVLFQAQDQELIVSRENVNEFRRWLGE